MCIRDRHKADRARILKDVEDIFQTTGVLSGLSKPCLLYTSFQGYGIQYDRGNHVYTTPLIFSKLIGEGNDYFNLHKRNDRGVTFSFNGT